MLGVLLQVQQPNEVRLPRHAAHAGPELPGVEVGCGVAPGLPAVGSPQAGNCRCAAGPPGALAATGQRLGAEPHSLGVTPLPLTSDVWQHTLDSPLQAQMPVAHAESSNPSPQLARRRIIPAPVCVG